MRKDTDKTYEALVEDYKDARMQLIAYQAAQENGKNPEDLKKTGLEAPGKLEARYWVHNRAPSAEGDWAGTSQGYGYRLYTAMRAVVIATLAAALLFCAAYALNEEFRVGVLNFFLELQENGTWFFRQNDDREASGTNQPQPSAPEGEFPFAFRYTPDGYELYRKERYDQGANGVRYLCTYGYTGQEFNHFSFEILTISEGLGLFIDTDDAEVEHVKIHGYDGEIVQKIDALSGEQEIIYVWFDLENQFGFIFTCMGISPEEAQKIFDGITISDPF